MASPSATTEYAAPNSTDEEFSRNSLATGPSKPLDIVFVQDTTGSQGPYIQAVKKAIRNICDKISTSGNLSKELIRFGLVAFRDHPPQDDSYVTKSFKLTSEVATIQKILASLIASGGGDGPEAQTAALAKALNMDWAKDSIRMVILITDSPPHGIGEHGDGFRRSPDQNDPLHLARQMAEHGITLFVVACEPALSKYRNAVDFYTALVQITGGKLLPLLEAERLGDYIVGSAIETIDTERLIGEFQQVIMDEVYQNNTPLDAVAEMLKYELQERGARLNCIEIENIYTESEASKKNVELWQHADNINEGRKKVMQVTGPRLQAKFSKTPQQSDIRLPEIRLTRQLLIRAHSRRVVHRAVARQSAVLPSEYVSRATGQSATFVVHNPSSD